MLTLFNFSILITHFEKYAKHRENELERQWNKGENWWMEFAGAIYWYFFECASVGPKGPSIPKNFEVYK